MQNPTTMKRTILLKVAVLMTLAMFALTSCNKYKDIKVTSSKVESVKLDGMRAADLVIALGVDNPAGKLEILELTGQLKHSGKVIGNVALDPFVLAPREEATYHLDMRVSLPQGFGLKDLLSFIKIKDVLALIKTQNVLSLINPNVLEEITVDVNAVGKAGGIKVRRSYKDIPLNKLLKK